MSLASLAAEVHEQQKWQQFEETWGHLYPKPGDHPGYMVVAHSDYNDQGVSVVHEHFEGVENSPWFYEWVTGFAFESMAGHDRRVTMRYNVAEWSVFDGDTLIFSNSDKKAFWKREEAEAHLAVVRERLADSASLSKIQWGRAEVREVHRVAVHKIAQRTKARSTGIWEFRGVLRVRPSGKARFVGKWTKMDLYPGRIPATKPRGPLLELSAAYQGKRKYMKHYVEGDRDYAESNMDSVVRFLDTMNRRRRLP